MIELAMYMNQSIKSYELHLSESIEKENRTSGELVSLASEYVDDV